METQLVLHDQISRYFTHFGFELTLLVFSLFFFFAQTIACSAVWIARLHCTALVPCTRSRVRCPWTGVLPPATPPRLPVSIFVQCRGLGTDSPPAACSREVIDGYADGDRVPSPVPLNQKTPIDEVLIHYALDCGVSLECGPPPRYTHRPPVSIFVQCRGSGTDYPPAACSREVIDGQAVKGKVPTLRPLQA